MASTYLFGVPLIAFCDSDDGEESSSPDTGIGEGEAFLFSLKSSSPSKRRCVKSGEGAFVFKKKADWIRGIRMKAHPVIPRSSKRLRIPLGGNPGFPEWNQIPLPIWWTACRSRQMANYDKSTLNSNIAEERYGMKLLDWKERGAAATYRERSEGGSMPHSNSPMRQSNRATKGTGPETPGRTACRKPTTFWGSSPFFGEQRQSVLRVENEGLRSRINHN